MTGDYVLWTSFSDTNDRFQIYMTCWSTALALSETKALLAADRYVC